MTPRKPARLTAKQAKRKVTKAFPQAGAELSAMFGWRILDYSDPLLPPPLSRPRKSEDEAWADAARLLSAWWRLGGKR
mgnify:CR=1 FL=1